MTELRRYNLVAKVIGHPLNVEFEAADEGQWVQADGAVTRVRELEYALIQIRNGVSLMVPEPQQSALLEIVSEALKGREQ